MFEQVRRVIVGDRRSRYLSHLRDGYFSWDFNKPTPPVLSVRQAAWKSIDLSIRSSALAETLQPEFEPAAAQFN